MVNANSAQIATPPNFIVALRSAPGGLPLGNAKAINAAGTSQLVSAGTNNLEEVEKLRARCACHTISVVMSPNALHAPPALAATTRLTQHNPTKRALPAPTASTIAETTKAVVRLLSTVESANASKPVTQNNVR